MGTHFVNTMPSMISETQPEISMLKNPSSWLHLVVAKTVCPLMYKPLSRDWKEIAYTIPCANEHLPVDV